LSGTACFLSPASAALRALQSFPTRRSSDLYKAACMLAPQGAVVGLSGGEPTLYKDELFDLLDFALTMRPDLRFHVLTNAQHFVRSEEHTSELQSRENLVCRLLLEKKKKATV